MTPVEAIEKIEYTVNRDTFYLIEEAVQTLKTAILAQQQITEQSTPCQKQTTNKRYTQCPKCGSARICFWMCHDRYGCYNCDWVEGTVHSVRCCVPCRFSQEVGV